MSAPTRHTFVIDRASDGSLSLVDHVGPTVPLPLLLGPGDAVSEVPPVQVFVAVANGPKYGVLGVGSTAEEAESAAFSSWLAQGPGGQIDASYGGPLLTVEAFREYFGFWTVGPLRPGEGGSE